MSHEQTVASEQPAVGSVVDRLIRFDGPPEAFLQQLLAAQCRLASAEGGAVLRRGDDGRASLIAAYPALDRAAPPLWLAQAIELIGQHPALTTPMIRPVHKADDLYDQPATEQLILLPLRAAAGVRGVAAFLIAASDPVEIDHRRQRLELTLSLLSLYEMRLTLQRREADLRGLATAVEVLAAGNEQRRFKAFAMALCNEVASRWQAERVGLGLLRGHYVKLQAMSQTEHISRKMRLVQDIESAMEECFDQDLEVIYPPPSDAGFVYRAAQTLHEQQGPSAICGLPLRHGGEVVGVLTVERPADDPMTVEQLEFLRLSCDLFTPRLVETHDRDRWFGARLASSSRKLLAAAVGPRHTWAKVTAIALFAAVLLLTFVPGEYRVEAPFVFEAVRRQVIPTPFDGYLETVSVEPGDAVEANDTVLASLDTTELMLERAALDAERIGYLKEADLARREGKTVEVQIAQAQADKARAQMRLLDHQIRQAQIISPISGILVEGDLKKQLGAPVARGDVLFEVAPLESLRAVLYVPDDRIGDIHVGQKGELAAASHPGAYLPFEVEQINPMAEVIDNRNVFRVRVKLLEMRPWMRPGVEGLAKADVGKRSYAWIWTRDAINWVRMKLWL